MVMSSAACGRMKGTCHRMDTPLRRRTLQNAGIMGKKVIDGVRVGQKESALPLDTEDVEPY